MSLFSQSTPTHPSKPCRDFVLKAMGVHSTHRVYITFTPIGYGLSLNSKLYLLIYLGFCLNYTNKADYVYVQGGQKILLDEKVENFFWRQGILLKSEERVVLRLSSNSTHV